MIKDILYIYWFKIKMFPTFVNNAFYYFITMKLNYALTNFFGMFAALFSIIMYPICVGINMIKLLYKRIRNEEEYKKMKINIAKYYSRSKKRIIQNQYRIDKLINEQ